MGVLPEEIIHIGDGETSDYLTPKQCGWHAILFRPGDPNYEINTLEKLKDLVYNISKTEEYKCNKI